MKRSPLNRKTPLKRKSPMKKVSAKQRKLKADTDGIRRFAIEYGVSCDRCQCDYATDCHEITAGYSRTASLSEPRTHLWLCRRCHEELQGKPYAQQVAVLVRSVIDAINAVRGCKAITDEDVAKELAKGE